MTDIYSKEKRSHIMSRIGGKETEPEILVRKFLFSKGLRFRKNVKSLPGKPDIVFPRYRAAILVHGCFWHGHTGCKSAKLPETRKEFWEEKILDNIKRDETIARKLEQKGWKVIKIWQCELKNKSERDRRLNCLLKEIRPENAQLQ